MNQQAQLVIALFCLLALGLGIVAFQAFMGSRAKPDKALAENEARLREEMERLTQARRKRHFLERYPDWADRDYEADPSSPWFSDPEFTQIGIGRR